MTSDIFGIIWSTSQKLKFVLYYDVFKNELSKSSPTLSEHMKQNCNLILSFSLFTIVYLLV